MRARGLAENEIANPHIAAFGAQMDPLRTRDASLERYVDLRKTTRRGSIYGGHNAFDVTAQSRPLLIAYHHKRDFPALQVLLVSQVFISGQQNLKTCGLGCRYQCAVRSPFPSAFNGFDNDMALKGVPERGRSAVIEEYEHRPVAPAAAGARQGYGTQTRSPLQPVHATNGTSP